MEESAKPHKSNVLVLSHEDGTDDHPPFPYWHTRVIGIYHVMVRQRTEGGHSPPSQMDFLFICWFGFDLPDGQSGWRARQMHKVGFLPDTDVHGPTFGFLDPREVIRMVHLIPDFTSIKTSDLLTGDSMAIPDVTDPSVMFACKVGPGCKTFKSEDKEYWRKGTPRKPKKTRGSVG